METIKAWCRLAARPTLCLLCVMLSMLYSPEVGAADYPDRAITLVVPYPAGGVTDIGARALAEALEKQLPKPVVVLNKPGGGTTIGGYAVVAAKPDGYTLGLLPPSASIPEAYTYFYDAPYASKDLKPICRVMSPVGALSVKSDSPINSYKDLVDYIRKNPGTKWAINVKSSPSYSLLRRVAKTEKLEIVEVPFNGDPDSIVAILGGHVVVGSATYPSIKSLVAAKKLKMLALVIDKRPDFAPDVPTIVELGYKLPPGLPIDLFGPKGTPEAIVKKLSDTVSMISGDHAFRSKLMDLGILPWYEDTKSIEVTLQKEKKELQAFFKEEGLVK